VERLVQRTYKPLPARRREIPKDGGNKVRVLSIPAIRDRVVQGALLRRRAHRQHGRLWADYAAVIRPGSVSRFVGRALPAQSRRCTLPARSD
jgi:hypothetical protein